MLKPTIDALTATVPQLGQSAAEFDANTNDFLPQLVPLQDQINVMIDWTDDTATAVAANAAAALISEAEAENAAFDANADAVTAAAAAQTTSEDLAAFEQSHIGKFDNDADANASGKPIADGTTYYKQTAPKGTRIYQDGAWGATVLDANGALMAANSLSDVPDKGAARAALELGSAATKDTGTTVGKVPLLGAEGKLPESVIPTTGFTAIRKPEIAGSSVQFLNGITGAKEFSAPYKPIYSASEKQSSDWQVSTSATFDSGMIVDTTIAGTSTTYSLNLASLSAFGSYYIRVRHTNADGVSPWSDLVELNTPGATTEVTTSQTLAFPADANTAHVLAVGAGAGGSGGEVDKGTSGTAYGGNGGRGGDGAEAFLSKADSPSGLTFAIGAGGTGGAGGYSESGSGSDDSGDPGTPGGNTTVNGTALIASGGAGGTSSGGTGSGPVAGGHGGNGRDEENSNSEKVPHTPGTAGVNGGGVGGNGGSTGNGADGQAPGGGGGGGGGTHAGDTTSARSGNDGGSGARGQAWVKFYKGVAQ